MGLTYKRHIIKNKPYEDANGQYNYGRIENEPRHLLGIPPDTNYGSDAIELFTTIEHKDVDWSRYPDGIAWNYFGSEIQIIELGIQGRDRETDDNRYYNHQVAVYLYDSDRTGLMPTTGNEIRALIGGGNSFPNGPHVVNQRDFGTYNFPTECDPNGWGGDECRRQFVGVNTEEVSYEFPQEKMIIYDWPMEGHSKTNSMFSTAVVFNTDIEHWSKAITGKIDNSYLYFVVRMSGDEKEYAPFGHGWLKLSGGYKNDELQRRYNVFRINKADLYDVFVRGEEKVFGYGSAGSAPYDKEMTHLGPYDDNHGGGGHWGLDNAQGAAYYCSDIRIKMKPPIWTPAKALTKNYRWVKKDTFGQLHPKYELDYTGFPQVFYQNPNKFWDSSYIKDFRPISKVKSIIDTDGNITDLQNYYEKGTPYAANSSAPMTVNLQFDLVRNINSFNPKYFPDGQELENNNYGIKYGWFVVNWDWNENWEGGTNLDEIAEIDFPQTAAGILTKNLTENTYKLKMQGDTSVDESEIEVDFDVLKNEAVHTYIDAGIKVIKVVFLTFIESNHAGQDLEGNDYAGNYIQALQWKLATVKINLSTDRAYANDFSDIGGADYTYLPYPEVQLYDYPEGEIQFDETSGNQLWCEDGINTPDGVIPSPFINCETETTAHPVISGLATESTYVQSLKGLLQTDHWGASEGGDRIMAEKSYENTPLQSVDEMGDFLGQSDLSTFRYFERPFNMHEFLDLNMVYTDSDPSNNIYCQEVRTYTQIGDNLVEDPYIPWPDGGKHWCGQRWASQTYQGENQGGTITSEIGVGNATFDGSSFQVAKARCVDGSEVILGFGQDGGGAYRMMYGMGFSDVSFITDNGFSGYPYPGMFYEGHLVDGPYLDGVWYGNVANGEWACAQQMGYPYDTVPDGFQIDDDPESFESITMTYQGELGLQAVEEGNYFHSYTDTEYWDGENNKFMTESSATDIFISEYPILHDKCLVELNYDSYDAVTIRDTSGNGCKAVAFGDYSIKKDAKNQPTQRDSSVDTPKIGSKNDDKAY